MERFIEILEEHIKELEEEKVLYGGFLSRKEAIENLLKAYKEDEAVIEEMAKYIGSLDTDEDICKEVDVPVNAFAECEIACKDCVKEYFRNKVKGE